VQLVNKKQESIRIFGPARITPFAKNVYKAVLSIPFGQVRSYKWVALKAGKPNAARAVGQALKHNPWPLIIPCHRVIGAGGKLGGYSSGIKNKKILLDLEKQIRENVV
jgi:methylated-DNA-[protein]-cysteine S-methyltransferase